MAAFTDVCRRHGIHPGMGRVGSRYDNALAKSFFSSFAPPPRFVSSKIKQVPGAVPTARAHPWAAQDCDAWRTGAVDGDVGRLDVVVRGGHRR
ncbi:hypothetical protein [Streptomyces sp. NPDC014685]|uniref:hypothetical protein n=1 Tax=Streptomyces sp. NPDC014685 TaxID=3364881 RepID=UPI0036F94421